MSKRKNREEKTKQEKKFLQECYLSNRLEEQIAIEAYGLPDHEINHIYCDFKILDVNHTPLPPEDDSDMHELERRVKLLKHTKEDIRVWREKIESQTKQPRVMPSNKIIDLTEEQKNSLPDMDYEGPDEESEISR
tara:strand:- start:4570 stop:4974 length:405 start_codon:yes stop_codon:yes gene_type:complete